MSCLGMLAHPLMFTYINQSCIWLHSTFYYRQLTAYFICIQQEFRYYWHGRKIWHNSNFCCQVWGTLTYLNILCWCLFTNYVCSVTVFWSGMALQSADDQRCGNYKLYVNCRWSYVRVTIGVWWAFLKTTSRKTSRSLNESLCLLLHLVTPAISYFIPFTVMYMCSDTRCRSLLRDHLHGPAVDSKQFMWDLKTYLFAGHSKC